MSKSSIFEKLVKTKGFLIANLKFDFDENGNVKYGFENVLLQSRSYLPSYQMVSPRFGVSFPITESTVLHYNYGHFYQMPPIKRMRYFRYFRPIQGTRGIFRTYKTSNV